MIKQTSLLCVGTLLLGACASSPNQQFAANVAAAEHSGQPLVIYDLTMDPPSPKVGLGFINTSGREIDRVAILVTAYRSSHPVWHPDGKPIERIFTLQGSLAAGRNFAAIMDGLHSPTGDAINCALLQSIDIRYKDGSSTHVEGDAARAYLTPQNNVHCGMQARGWSNQSEVAAAK